MSQHASPTPTITFELSNAAADAIARATDLSSDTRAAIALARPVRHAMRREVTCSREAAHEMLEWFRAAATNALLDSLPQSIERGRRCFEAMAAIRVALAD